MAASLFRAMMCFLKPVMPRSISGLVMQLMRVANVGGGGLAGRGDS